MMKRILFSLAVLFTFALSVQAQDVKPLTSANFEQVVTGQRPYVIDFYATWCGPCRMFSPTFAEVASEMSKTVDFYKMDVDAEKEIAAQIGIASIPTIFIYNPANKKSNVVQGLVDKASFIAEIKKVF